MHVDDLKNQLSIARNEINNLRQKVRNLQYVQRKDIETINRLLQDFRCEDCTIKGAVKDKDKPQLLPMQTASNDVAYFKPIGIIRSAFPEKRAVPRQSSVGNRLRSIIQLNDGVFTNPEHSLVGLADFSHMWLIYHFHQNKAHPKAKVAPPRLGGDRIGVFSTRSPHRPFPVGLSLVEIGKIDGSTISFYGTDMINGTPVLDIKPYIPQYDTPILSVGAGNTSIVTNENNANFYDSRQEPDGEESDLDLYGAAGYAAGNFNVGVIRSSEMQETPPPPNKVSVPNWVVACCQLRVFFNEHAEDQIQELQVHKQCIVDILEADPRSVYLRTKYGSQIFNFQLSELTVTCKFDDNAGIVTVVQVRRNENILLTELDGESHNT